jgi:hypothetical protein
MANRQQKSAGSTGASFNSLTDAAGYCITAPPIEPCSAIWEL